jgi:hypothetical protein
VALYQLGVEGRRGAGGSSAWFGFGGGRRLRFPTFNQGKPNLFSEDLGGSEYPIATIWMGAARLNEANGSDSRAITCHLEQDLMEGYDTKSEGEIEEARKGLKQKRI